MLLNAQFVWRELPIRYAHRVKQLRSLQFGLNECEQIQKAADSYTAHAQQMHDRPKPVDAETKASFDQLRRSYSRLPDPEPEPESAPLEAALAWAEAEWGLAKHRYDHEIGRQKLCRNPYSDCEKLV